MKSKKHIGTFAAVAALAVAGVTATAVARDDDGRIRSDMMIGLPAGLTSNAGTAGTIRDVLAAGAPWSIGESEISVKSSGKIEAEFQNLVLTNTGLNPVGSMQIVVSCLNAPKVTSASFAVTVNNPGIDPGGDADVETKVDLPSPCLAPIVFIVNANTGGWFAVDGL